MSEVARIREQMRRAFEKDAWHGPSVNEALEGVTAAKAAARPLGEAHSIWEIVLHIATTDAVVLRRLSGDLTPLADADWWPPAAGSTEAEWSRALVALRSGQAKLLDAVSRLADDRLDDPMGKGYSSFYVNLHGLIQHDLYHTGQIAVLKKA
jgi:uncharacterized damage-inducible protein DinB